MPLGNSIEEARAYYASRVADLGDDERADELKEFKFLMARLLTAKNEPPRCPRTAEARWSWMILPPKLRATTSATSRHV